MKQIARVLLSLLAALWIFQGCGDDRSVGRGVSLAPPPPKLGSPAPANTCPSGFRTVNFFNDCGATIWPGAQNLSNSGKVLNGWELPPSASCSANVKCPSGQNCVNGKCAYTVCLNNNSASVKFWARTNCQFTAGVCSLNNNSCTAAGKPYSCCTGPKTGNCSKNTPCCDSGDCQPGGVGAINCAGAGPLNAEPASFGEITLGQGSGHADFYDVSIINGFNVGIEIDPVPPPGGKFAGAPSGNAKYYWCTNSGAAVQPQNKLGACDWSQLEGANCPKNQQFTGGVSGKIGGCLTGTNICGTGWPNSTATGAFDCTQAVENTPPSSCPASPNASCSGAGKPYFCCTGAGKGTCKSNDFCPGLTGLNGTGGTSCGKVKCPPGTVCSTTNIYLNNPKPPVAVCEETCSAGNCTAPACTANPVNNKCPAGQTCCDAGPGSPLAGTFMVCDVDAKSSTYHRCVQSVSSIFQCSGINGQSCYGNSSASTCGGCATAPVNPLHTSWPDTPAQGCTNLPGDCCNNNPNWASIAQPPEAKFKTACPTAYSYQFDDPTSTFNCDSTPTQNSVNYNVTFCPAK